MLFQNIVSGELPDLDFEGRLHVVQLLPVGEYVDEDFVFVGTLDRKHIQVLLGNFEFELEIHLFLDFFKQKLLKLFTVIVILLILIIFFQSLLPSI
jgi:hypothetical protein